MDTLIELYDERPLENVLGVEMFRPARVVYICPEEIARDTRLQDKLRSYFPSLPLARIHKLKIGYILRTNTRNI